MPHRLATVTEICCYLGCLVNQRIKAKLKNCQVIAQSVSLNFAFSRMKDLNGKKNAHSSDFFYNNFIIGFLDKYKMLKQKVNLAIQRFKLGLGILGEINVFWKLRLCYKKILNCLLLSCSVYLQLLPTLHDLMYVILQGLSNHLFFFFAIEQQTNFCTLLLPFT